MSSRTPFAGLELLAPGELLSTDSFRFQAVNPSLIDRLLQVGAVTHRHDEHAAVGNPAETAEAVNALTGGAIPAGLNLSIGYTWIDDDGGETLISGIETVETAAAVDDPQEAPTAELKTDAGALLVGNYDYGVTITDGAGGETALSPAASANVLPGPHARVLIGRLKLILEAAGVGGAEWRLWRRLNGGLWYLVEQGIGETVNDNGTLAGDCTVAPPSTSTILGSNEVTITVTEAAPARVSHFNLYVSRDGSFVSPCLVAQYPIAKIGEPIVLAGLAPAVGAPPLVSTSIPGASKINPDTDLIEWNWKRHLAKVSELPTEGNDVGDIRLVIEGPGLYFWTGTEWEKLVLEAEPISTHWKETVGKVEALPTKLEGAEAGDVRLVLEGHKLYTYVEETEEWVLLAVPFTLTVEDEASAELPMREKMQFTGAGVAVADDEPNGRTVVTVTGSSPSWRPPLEKVSELPAEGNTAGDVIFVEEGEGSFHEWTGTEWRAVGGGGGGGTPKAAGSCQVRGETPLTEHAPGVEAKLAVATVDWDVSEWWDAANHRFIPQLPGVYLVSVAFQGAQAVTEKKWSDVLAAKNGVALPNVFSRQQSVSSEVGPEGGASGLVEMNGSTDFLEIWGACVNGGAVGGGPLAGEAILGIAYFGEI